METLAEVERWVEFLGCSVETEPHGHGLLPSWEDTLLSHSLGEAQSSKT